MNTIPSFGFGTWKLPKATAASIVYQAIVSGVRHFDCAADYGNEVEVGKGIQQALSEKLVTREDLWITSKLWNTYHLPEHVEAACRKSLQDLQLEYLDLYMVHFPISLKFVPFEKRYPPEWIHDPSAEHPKIELEKRAPMHLTWHAMEALVHERLTRFIGVCNFSYQLLSDLLSYANIAPYAHQMELHPYLVQPQLVEFCLSNGLKVVAFSPFGSPSYVEMGMDGGLGVGPLAESSVVEIAAAHQKTPAQVVLRWALQRGVAVIPKSCQQEHVRENLAAQDLALSEQEVSAALPIPLSPR